jgi:hypothetical protein
MVSTTPDTRNLKGRNRICDGKQKQQNQ